MGLIIVSGDRTTKSGVFSGYGILGVACLGLIKSPIAFRMVVGG